MGRRAGPAPELPTALRWRWRCTCSALSQADRWEAPGRRMTGLR